MNFVVLSVVLFLYISCTASKQLPSYIHRCSFSKNLDECFVKHANLAIPNLINGDKDIKLPTFNPLHVDEVIFSPSDTLKIHFTKLEVSGFQDAKITKAHCEQSNETIYFTLHIPKLVAKSQYKAHGKILIVPIEGEGPCEIQLINPEFAIELSLANFNLESSENIKLKNTHVIYNVEKSIYHFEKLFNGNKKLGDDMNKFLNENQAELHKDFGTVFSNIMQQIVENIIGQTLGQLIYKDVILP